MADVLRLDHGKFTDIPTPDSVTMTSFHKENAGLFAAPEYRDLTVVLLQPEDVADDVNVPEQRVQDEYDSRINEFTKLETREIHQILVSDEPKLEISKRPSRRGFYQGGQEVAGMKEALTQGNLRNVTPVPICRGCLSSRRIRIEPIQTALGWHILRVDKVIPQPENTGGGSGKVDARRAIDMQQILSSRSQTNLGMTSVVVDP